MEKIKNLEGWEVINKKRGRPRKQRTQEDLVNNFEAKEAPIPDWKSLNIKDFVQLREDGRFDLKDIKENEKWEKYINIKWRIYVQYEWWEQRPESYFSVKWNTMFIWDKIEWTSFWDWVYINCSTFIQWSIYIEERKAKYSTANRAIHLWQLYRSNSYTLSETLATIHRNWKTIKITQDMVDRFLKWNASKTEEINIEYAKKTDPEFFAYFESYMW